MRAAGLLALAGAAFAQQQCGKLDLILCLDGSTSITDSDWQLDLQAGAFIANNFTWGGANGIAMGVVQFGTQEDPCFPGFGCEPKVLLEQALTTDKSTFLSTLSNVQQIHGGTPTGPGLDRVLTEFTADARPGAQKATLLITDGEPNIGGGESAAVAASKALQAAGSPVFIIGVGDANNNKADIDRVASQPAAEYVVYAKNWQDVGPLLHDVVKGLCPTPAPTPKPTPKPTPAPLPPAPTPAPPLYSAPCIRVLNSIPSPHAVDVEIVQGSLNRSYTWKGYGFGDYSNWTSKFETGKGTINIIDSKSGKTLLSIPDAPLTPGPLVVAVKCPASAAQGACWPPSDPQLGGSVETIAASFAPPTQGSGVRLFNLSPDTQSASLVEGGKAVASRVGYGGASEWVPVPSHTPLKSTIMDDTSGKVIASDTTSPPAAPSVFTLWLLGNQTTTGWDVVGGDGAYSVKTLSLEDAPHDEQGVLLCQPSQTEY